jgi:hypothetical protein
VRSPKPSTRLYVLLARKAPIAAVFRRGPSKRVLLLTWNTETHEVRKGQWFKGRIYERRCDISHQARNSFTSLPNSGHLTSPGLR